ncbi:hypothetical protein CXG81DRAFT_27743 [Caulochytrium protostelioides]|uniref:J domain-containing protein n=1 Tax=Caulochytrium protostelioides TaxID=1555241 RepID=A0A4P9X3C2_9FUNG|nr:hypothetical protein CXG81DRAFT_27743 [Caulochytrium protostelioides]|eukprot:RKO99504.1 hypothetical protein CXG81DRAFT_27743 [Caulochytrium protostelioides]
MQSIDLYAEFGVARDADDAAIKRAYHKLALRYHPDKVARLESAAERDAATAKFQEVAHWYAILSDPPRRQRYDQTGVVGAVGAGALSGSDGADWSALFEALWESRVTTAAIDAFSAKYKGSAEERADLLANYALCGGDVEQILERQILADEAERGRLVGILRAAVAAAEIAPTPAFAAYRAPTAAAQKRRQRAAQREAAEADAALAELRARDPELAERLRAAQAAEAPSDHASDASDHQSDDDGGDDRAPDAPTPKRARPTKPSAPSAATKATAKPAAAKPAAAKPSAPKKSTAKSAHSKAPSAPSKEMDALAQLIQSRGRAKMSSLFDQMEAKYTAIEEDRQTRKRGRSGAAGAARHTEPSEEEFAAVQARLMRQRASPTPASTSASGSAPKSKASKASSPSPSSSKSASIPKSSKSSQSSKQTSQQ